MSWYWKQKIYHHLYFFNCKTDAYNDVATDQSHEILELRVISGNTMRCRSSCWLTDSAEKSSSSHNKLSSYPNTFVNRHISPLYYCIMLRLYHKSHVCYITNINTRVFFLLVFMQIMTFFSLLLKFFCIFNSFMMSRSGNWDAINYESCEFVGKIIEGLSIHSFCLYSQHFKHFICMFWVFCPHECNDKSDFSFCHDMCKATRYPK